VTVPKWFPADNTGLITTPRLSQHKPRAYGQLHFLRRLGYVT
jgi:hypothetical protein